MCSRYIFVRCFLFCRNRTKSVIGNTILFFGLHLPFFLLLKPSMRWFMWSSQIPVVACERSACWRTSQSSGWLQLALQVSVQLVTLSTHPMMLLWGFSLVGGGQSIHVLTIVAIVFLLSFDYFGCFLMCTSRSKNYPAHRASAVRQSDSFIAILTAERLDWTGVF